MEQVHINIITAVITTDITILHSTHHNVYYHWVIQLNSMYSVIYTIRS